MRVRVGGALSQVLTREVSRLMFQKIVLPRSAEARPPEDNVSVTVLRLSNFPEDIIQYIGLASALGQGQVVVPNFTHLFSKLRLTPVGA